ncbi:hypothetical protein [Hymenobacter bucti]|uniref:Uncharacterized protein n=1 Tax=Hymenobacter bucti TaxID=1844114 RepID=A0ABW4QZ67_9BACT
MISALSQFDSSPALLQAGLSISGNGISGIDLVVPLLAAINMCACFIARKEMQGLSNKAVTAVAAAVQNEQVLPGKQAPEVSALRAQLVWAECKADQFPAFTGGTSTARLKRGEVLVTLPAPRQIEDRRKYAWHTKEAAIQQKAMGDAAVC